MIIRQFLVQTYMVNDSMQYDKANEYHNQVVTNMIVGLLLVNQRRNNTDEDQIRSFGKESVL